ncbi:enoyl-CoA hydratase/isomerase family protein [Nocardioides sp. CN2-186]|uniref:enoyl-CoA hydratase/isomerase family protein n=1 Tax=Nocardioides tweenelious TaxID=3156607 RepID=UPI0032B3A3FB
MTITLESRGPVAVVWFDRPDKLNAVTAGDFITLRDILRSVAEDPGCRVVVLTGRGRGFCAGLDLDSGFGEPGPGSIPRTYAELRVGVDAIRLLREMPQPVVAAVHGNAVGAGFAFACAADLRVASPEAVFAAPFTRLGMTPGDLGLSWFLPRLLGVSATADLFLRGGSVTGADGHRLGLVNELAEDPFAVAMVIAEEIAGRAPMGVRQAKELLNASLLGGFREHLEIEIRSQVLLAMTDDHAEAKDAFRARREPVFRDR